MILFTMAVLFANTGYCEIECKTEGNGNYQDDATLQYPRVYCLMTCNFSFWCARESMGEFPRQEAARCACMTKQQDHMCPAILPQPPREPCCWRAELPTASCLTSTCRQSHALLADFKVISCPSECSSTHYRSYTPCVCSPRFLLWTPSINCCLSNLFATLLLCYFSGIFLRLFFFFVSVVCLWSPKSLAD